MWEAARMKLVNCPSGFANALLNGSTGIVLWEFDKMVALLLVSGPQAGREWQFFSNHLCDA